jgi:hypothetical protein
METNLSPPAAGLAMEKHAGLWMAAIVLMGICVIATFWYPLLSIEALPSRNYNEGWNAYRQWMTVQGQPLYGARNALWTTNYPFLSFHIIGLLGRTKANMVLTGRIVSFASRRGFLFWRHGARRHRVLARSRLWRTAADGVACRL